MITGIQEVPQATGNFKVPQTMAHGLPSISRCIPTHNQNHKRIKPTSYAYSPKLKPFAYSQQPAVLVFQ